MPLAPEEKPGKSFATDMRLIREQRGLSQQDIYRATKLPLEIVTLFEQTGLLNHPRYNRVYLRSFVREYARVVGIKENDAIEGLEAAMAGQYRGALAYTYLGIERGGGHAQRQQDTPWSATEPPAEPAAPVADRPRSEAKRAPDLAARQDGGSGGFGPTRKPRAGRAPRPGRTAMIASLAILAVAVAAVVYVFFLPAREPVADRSGMNAAAVEPPIPAMEDSVPTQPATPVLADTMFVRVIAVGGKLEPIRRSADGSAMIPHWVEEGDTLSFRAVTEFALQVFLERISVTVEGHPIDTSVRDAENRLVVTRAELLERLESGVDSTR